MCMACNKAPEVCEAVQDPTPKITAICNLFEAAAHGCSKRFGTRLPPIPHLRVVWRLAPPMTILCIEFG